MTWVGRVSTGGSRGAETNNEHSGIKIQRSRDSHDGVEGRTALTSLEMPDESPMESSLLSQLLLRHSKATAGGGHPPSELGGDLWISLRCSHHRAI